MKKKWCFLWYSHIFNFPLELSLKLHITSSVQFSCSVVSDSLQPHELQHARPPCSSQTPGVHPNPCPSSQWCQPAISSSVIPFASCLQTLPASGSFPMSQPFMWGGQSIGVSASASVLPMNTHHWSPLGWTGWISLQSKGLSRVFTSTTVQKHQYFGAQLSSQSNSHIHTWPLEKPLALFVVMLSKAHLTSHSRISGSRWVITPSWLSGSWRSFLYIGIHISPPS